MVGIDLHGKGLFDSISLGGSEIPRVAIAKFFALLESKNDNSIVMPIIFDFPNLDMTTDNIIKCFKLMCEKISDTGSYPQSFIFSINCNERIEMAGCSLENTHCIDLGELDADDKEHPLLLCKNDYELKKVTASC